MKKFHNLSAILIAIIIIFIDQLSKDMAKSFLALGSSLPLINNIFHLTLVHNVGAGFGILKGQRLFFITFSFIVMAILAYRWKKIPSNINVTIPMGLVIGGLIGNLIDRIFLSYVVDFLDFRVWPVFNMADSAITIGVVWLIIYLWKEK